MWFKIRHIGLISGIFLFVMMTLTVWGQERENKIVEPLLGEKTGLRESEWKELLAKFSGYESWILQKAGASVEKLGMDKIRAFVDGRARESITELIAKDFWRKPFLGVFPNPFYSEPKNQFYCTAATW
jgi:hypothetical protein